MRTNQAAGPTAPLPRRLKSMILMLMLKLSPRRIKSYFPPYFTSHFPLHPYPNYFPSLGCLREESSVCVYQLSLSIST